jgi:hypothetical protein
MLALLIADNDTAGVSYYSHGNNFYKKAVKAFAPTVQC